MFGGGGRFLLFVVNWRGAGVRGDLGGFGYWFWMVGCDLLFWVSLCFGLGG